MMPDFETRDIPMLLKGSIVAQHIRCSKECCRCRTGEKHGPYHYRVWRDGVHIRKTYVRAGELAAVQAACDAHQKAQDHLRACRQKADHLTQNLKREWRRTERLLRS